MRKLYEEEIKKRYVFEQKVTDMENKVQELESEVSSLKEKIKAQEEVREEVRIEDPEGTK